MNNIYLYIDYVEIVEILLKYYHPSKEEVLSLLGRFKGRIDPRIVELLKKSCGLPLDKGEFRKIIIDERRNKFSSKRKRPIRNSSVERRSK